MIMPNPTRSIKTVRKRTEKGERGRDMRAANLTGWADKER